MNGLGRNNWFDVRWLALASFVFLGGCGKDSDPSRPAASSPKGLQERLSSGGGYKQDENGQWIPKSDKRSSFESQRDSPYFKGRVTNKEYSTGGYAKKDSWWGNKQYGTTKYGGETGTSRFQGTTARQDGLTSLNDGKAARESGTFTTNTNRNNAKTARESGSSEVSRPTNDAVQARRNVYKAPSVIDWKEQRSMSMEQSKGILGR